jgi:DNA polymerase-3 subunit beta
MLVRRKDLEDAIRIIMCCIPKRAYSKVMESCMMDFCEEGITLTATDFEVGASVCVPSMNANEQQNSIVVDARNFASLVGKSKNSNGQVQISLKDDKLCVGKGKISPAAAAEDFPEMLFPPAKGSKVYLLSVDFLHAVKFAVPARTGDYGRYTLNGIYLDFRHGRLVSTDGKRLHCAVLGEPAAIPGMIISPRLFKVVAPEAIVVPPPIETKEGSEVVKRIAHLFFPVQNGICVTRVIDGIFPEYTNHIPKKCPSRMQVERSALLQSLRTAKRASAQNLVCSMIMDGNLTLLVKDEEEGMEYVETVPGKLKGRKAIVKVNPSFLYDCVSGLTTETVHLYFQGPEKPILIEDKEGWFGLVMPLAKVESINSS